MTRHCHVKAALRMIDETLEDVHLTRAIVNLMHHDVRTLCEQFYRRCAPQRAFDVSPLPDWPAVALPIVAAHSLLDVLENWTDKDAAGFICMHIVNVSY